jgi:hypothetical protein
VTDVYLESGRKRVFACAVDWPGWARSGRTEDAALEALLAYAPRYAAVVPGFAPGALHVVGRVPGTATTDFGAPDARGPWDERPYDGDRLAGLLERCWAGLDAVVATAPQELRKGPRGGGRDRDAVVAHVREAERSYGRTIGVRVPPRTPWPEQRAALAAAVRAQPTGTRWPVPYHVRRTAWHVLDHAWEVEDRSA